MSYSQNNEETIIVDYFQSNHAALHRFLEIGAYDPVALSNTRRLVELGWSGVYVEPAPDNAARFLRQYRGNPNILLVNAAIGLESRLITFYDSGGDAVSTASPEHVQKWEAGSSVRFAPYLTKTITLQELFGAVSHNFSFINLDVESLNIDLFRQLPFDLLKGSGLQLLCVEHDGHYEEMRATMHQHGFRELSFNGENLIFGL